MKLYLTDLVRRQSPFDELAPAEFGEGNIQIDRLPPKFGPRAQGSITGDFVVLDSLRGRKQAGVESDRTFVFPHDFSTLVGDVDDSRTRLSLRLLFNYREDLFEPSDVLLGFTVVLLKGCP